MQIKEIFPLTFMVSTEIIEKSNVQDIHNCIGANSLSSAIEEKMEIAPKWKSWGNNIGVFQMIDNNEMYGDLYNVINVESNIRMMNITEPTEVIFTLI